MCVHICGRNKERKRERVNNFEGVHNRILMQEDPEYTAIVDKRDEGKR